MRAGALRRRVAAQTRQSGRPTRPRSQRWPRPIGWGVAALVSAALWLAIASLAWWWLYD
jgi:hypothetical protein